MIANASTSSSPSSSTISASHVLLFLPNLIGYSRVIMALASFVCMFLFESLWFWAVCLYVGSFVGDLFDGLVARKFDQTSTFGSVLDMVTDRCATVGLLMVLTAQYKASGKHPLLPLLFVCLAILDVSSHWCQMYASLSIDMGHHKSEQANQNRNFLVRWFYKYYFFFGYLCVGAEFTYVLLYIQLYNDTSLASLLLFLCLPGCAAKQVVNVAQLLSSCHAIAQLDAKNYVDQRTKQK